MTYILNYFHHLMINCGDKYWKMSVDNSTSDLIHRIPKQQWHLTRRNGTSGPLSSQRRRSVQSAFDDRSTKKKKKKNTACSLLCHLRAINWDQSKGARTRSNWQNERQCAMNLNELQFGVLWRTIRPHRRTCRRPRTHCRRRLIRKVLTSQPTTTTTTHQAASENLSKHIQR